MNSNLFLHIVPHMVSHMVPHIVQHIVPHIKREVVGGASWTLIGNDRSWSVLLRSASCGMKERSLLRAGELGCDSHENE